MRSILQGAWLRVPQEHIADAPGLRRELTLANPAFDPDRKNDKIKPFIKVWRFDEIANEVLVPKHFDIAPYLRPNDRKRLLALMSQTYPVNAGMVSGLPPIIQTATPRNDLQRESTEWLAKGVDGRLMLRAGAGKTVVALMAAAQAGILPVLVVVHEGATMEQWIDRIVEHTGVPRFLLGTVQGQKADFQGKPITVAMMQTLALGEDRDPDRWNDLKAYMKGGLVIYDEADVYAPAKMQLALSMFEATRWGLTATYRHDGLQKVIEWHLGSREFYRAGYDLDPLIVSCRVQVPPYLGNYSNLSRCITQLEVEDDAYRNALWRVVRESVDRGRKTLLLLQRTEAIESFGQRAANEGIDAGIIHGGVKQGERLDVLRGKQLVIANRRIAGRALDASDIATIVTGPTSSPALGEQIAGRALRVHEGKKQPVVVVAWPYAGGGGMAMGQLAGMARKMERVLRACGFDKIKYVKR